MDIFIAGRPRFDTQKFATSLCRLRAVSLVGTGLPPPDLDVIFQVGHYFCGYIPSFDNHILQVFSGDTNISLKYLDLSSNNMSSVSCKDLGKALTQVSHSD